MTLFKTINKGFNNIKLIFYTFSLIFFFITSLILISYPKLQAQVSDSLIENLKNANSDSLKIEILNQLLIHYIGKNDVETTEQYAEDAVAIAKATNFPIDAAKSLHEYADELFHQSEFKNALTYYKKALDIYTETNDSTNIYIVFSKLGNIYSSVNNNAKALELQIKALQYFQKKQDKKNLAASYNNLGIIYNNINQQQKSIEFHNLGKDIYESLKDTAGIIKSYNNIGISYKQIQNFERAYEYYMKSLKLSEIINNKRSQSAIYTNLGALFEDKGKYNQAIEYYFKALKIKEQINHKSGIALLLFNIGSIYKKINNKEIALEYFYKSLGIAQKIEDYERILDCYYEISEVYSDRRKFEEAYSFLKKYFTLFNSQYSITDQRKISELENRYEIDKRDKEIELLNKEKQVKNLEIANTQNEIKRQKTIQWILISGFFGLIIFVVVLLRLNRKYKNALDRIAEQKAHIINQKEEIQTQAEQLEEIAKKLEKYSIFPTNDQKKS